MGCHSATVKWMSPLCRTRGVILLHLHLQFTLHPRTYLHLPPPFHFLHSICPLHHVFLLRLTRYMPVLYHFSLHISFLPHAFSLPLSLLLTFAFLCPCLKLPSFLHFSLHLPFFLCITPHSSCDPLPLLPPQSPNA